MQEHHETLHRQLHFWMQGSRALTAREMTRGSLRIQPHKLTLMSKLENREESSTSSQPPAPLVTIGIGLPGLPKKLIARVLANEYIDFSELPPAKGKGRPMPQSLEGQVIMVQATELLQARKIIPDLATWMQCFSIYAAALCAKYPARLPELMAYQTIIAKASQRYWWPSWVVYDQNFRQEAAGNPHQSWARVEPRQVHLIFWGMMPLFT